MSRANLERLTKEIKQFETYLDPTPHEKKARDDLFHKIESAIKCLFPKASVVPYGSYETQLLLPSSDIDLCIQMGDVNPRSVLQKIKAHMKKYYYDTITAGELILNAVPVFHLQDPATSLTADVTVQSNIHSSTRTVAWMGEYPEIKPLFLFLKHALLGIRLQGDPHYEAMNAKRSGIASFSLICLIVHYLMYNKESEGFTDPATRLGRLLLGFLAFYSTFDFDSIGLTFELENGYFHKTTNGIVFYDHALHRSGLTIVNPDDPDVNVARSTQTTDHFQAILKWMYQEIKAAVDQDESRHSYLSSIITVEPHPVDASRKSLSDYKFPVKHLTTKALGVRLPPVDPSKFADKKSTLRERKAGQDKVTRFDPYNRTWRRRQQR